MQTSFMDDYPEDLWCRWDLLGIVHGGADGGAPQDEGGRLDAPLALQHHADPVGGGRGGGSQRDTGALSDFESREEIVRYLCVVCTKRQK